MRRADRLSSTITCSVSDHERHSPDPARPLVIWLISDGRAGHVTQSLGLARAIESRITAVTHIVPISSSVLGWCDFIRRRTSLGRDLPDPDVIIGVGHRTHPAMLAVRASRGGRAVVLMQPTLPLSIFDLAIIPQHDAAGRRSRFSKAATRLPNVIVSRGVLNPIRPASDPQPDLGLILLGGPSRHVRWSDDAVIEQVRVVAADDQDMRWELTTSRRTPSTMIEKLRGCDLPNVSITPFDQSPKGWVAQQLDRCSRAWVSGDSVSMMYEALSAGAAVGVLEVPQRRRNSRGGAGLDELIRDGLVTSFLTWEQTRQLNPPRTIINEADRCAEYIVERWFSDRLAAAQTEVATSEGARR